jgi:hypothetical protein
MGISGIHIGNNDIRVPSFILSGAPGRPVENRDGIDADRART